MKALLLVLAAAGVASANGRNAATSTINFRRGHPDDVLAGMTFGAVISHDRGKTWQWICEEAIGYGGAFDPVYAWTASGKILATTFLGLKAATDGCTFNDVAGLDEHFVSAMTYAPDGTLFIGMDDPKDDQIHTSHDEGATFPAMTMPGRVNDWWESIAVAPGDAKRMYLTGYRDRATGSTDRAAYSIDGAQHVQPRTDFRDLLTFRSDDGGATWLEIPLEKLPHQLNTSPQIAAISPEDPDEVYAHFVNADQLHDDVVYRSTDAGATWTKILDVQGMIAFLRRTNGDLIAASQKMGSQISHDSGATWQPIEMPPHVGCLVEDMGEVWACTQNSFDMAANIPADGAGIMVSTDLVTWTPKLRFEDIVAPVACDAGSMQHQFCEAKVWCGLRKQLHITADPTGCPMATEAVIPLMQPPPAGCCDARAHPDGLVIAGAVGMILVRRRRRCSVPSTASRIARSTSRSC